MRSLKTIRRYLVKAATQADCTLPQTPVSLIMDTTYFSLGRHGSLRRPQQARLDSCGSRAGNQRALYAGGRYVARKRGFDTKHYSQIAKKT